MLFRIYKAIHYITSRLKQIFYIIFSSKSSNTELFVYSFDFDLIILTVQLRGDEYSLKPTNIHYMFTLIIWHYEYRSFQTLKNPKQHVITSDRKVILHIILLKILKPLFMKM